MRTCELKFILAIASNVSTWELNCYKREGNHWKDTHKGIEIGEL